MIQDIILVLKMKIFVLIRKYSLVWGLQPPEPNHKHSFNWKNRMAFIFTMKWVLLSILALLYEPRTLSEYTEAIDALMKSCLVIGIFLVFTLKMGKIFTLINKFEAAIEKRRCYLLQLHLFDKFIILKSKNAIQIGVENSASRKIYEIFNAQFEKFTKIIYFMSMNVTMLGIMTPNLIYSYFVYFTTESESDAFTMPFPEW